MVLSDFIVKLLAKAKILKLGFHQIPAYNLSNISGNKNDNDETMTSGGNMVSGCVMWLSAFPHLFPKYA